MRAFARPQLCEQLAWIVSPLLNITSTSPKCNHHVSANDQLEYSAAPNQRPDRACSTSRPPPRHRLDVTSIHLILCVRSEQVPSFPHLCCNRLLGSSKSKTKSTFVFVCQCGVCINSFELGPDFFMQQHNHITSQSLVIYPARWSSPLYWDLCIDHLYFQHSENTEI